MKGGWVYIITNRPNGTLYVGVTSDLPRRIREHHDRAVEGFSRRYVLKRLVYAEWHDRAVEGFSRRYVLKRLVYAEWHDDIRNAIQRETSLKHWSRAKKVWLIVERNPLWRDLYDQRPL